MDLRGPSGSLASAAIVVENTRPDTADVVCRVSEFTARAFGRRFRAAVTIDPEHFRLGAGEQQDVTLQLPLDEAVFAPGADYVATLQISGAGDRELIVQLLARADASAAEAEPRDSNAAVQPPGEADTREAADAPRRTSRAGSTRRSTASRQRKRR